MKNRINNLFSQSKGRLLSVYFTAGFPKLDDTAVIAKALEQAGADMIEIGIPFSDPVADGPTIQQSNKVALENGMNVKLLLEQVASVRKATIFPIVLMGYLNPVMQYGMERFVKDAAQAGVDGLILPDLPLFEYEDAYRKMFTASGITHTFLISPTTSDNRMRMVDQASDGFVYAVSASSTTGAKDGFSDSQVKYFERLKGSGLRNPLMIGFGISTKDTFDTATTYAAGAIVGSAFINLLTTSKNMESDIPGFVKSIKG